MARSNPPLAWTRPDFPVSRLVFFAIALISVVLDQFTKFLAVRFLLPRLKNPDVLAQAVEVIPNYFALLYRENTGAAFSLFTEHTGLLALFSGMISLGFIGWAWRLRPSEQGMRLALGLIVGGAVGNLIDRVLHGYVIDFLHAHWQWTYQWPTFNVADSSVCIGMGMLVLMSFRMPRESEAGAGATQTTATAKSEPSH